MPAFTSTLVVVKDFVVSQSTQLFTATAGFVNKALSKIGLIKDNLSFDQLKSVPKKYVVASGVICTVGAIGYAYYHRNEIKRAIKKAYPCLDIDVDSSKTSQEVSC